MKNEGKGFNREDRHGLFEEKGSDKFEIDV